MRYAFYGLLLVAGWLCGNPNLLRAQYVQWQPEQLVQDLVQDGLYPDATTDAVGNLHIVYWNRHADRLVYGMLPRNSRTVQ
jgi:hypothetical protein